MGVSGPSLLIESTDSIITCEETGKRGGGSEFFLIFFLECLFSRQPTCVFIIIESVDSVSRDDQDTSIYVIHYK